MTKDKLTPIHEYHLNRYQPDKPQFAIHDLSQYLNKNQRDTSKPHIHSYYQIIWFKRGTGKHFVDFRQYDVSDNAIFFISKNQVHYFDQKTDYAGILIHFNEAFLVQKDNKVDFFLKYNLFNNPYQLPSCSISQGIDHILDEYITQIRRELQNEESFGKEELIRIYLKAFLIQVQRRIHDFERNATAVPFTLDDKKIYLIKFVNLIDDNYTKGLTVAEYAQLLHISSRTLSDLTNHTLGKTPSQMIQERLILEAQRLLLHSNLNVNQIGYRLGFDDPSYFVKYFKKHTKLSPSDFRKSVS
ncbi:AraC family transcriptional regulator [Pontibacter liquoris]|uniref:AraC family transcriptional regulator n=1 Tax=Pontibacter liquoris TaxID=2905677 RepID=UPI001FA6C77F|nr:AraC family transcriptional regulator [Pontibacter liquoris]